MIYINVIPSKLFSESSCTLGRGTVILEESTPIRIKPLGPKSDYPLICHFSVPTHTYIFIHTYIKINV